MEKVARQSVVDIDREVIDTHGYCLVCPSVKGLDEFEKNSLNDFITLRRKVDRNEEFDIPLSKFANIRKIVDIIDSRIRIFSIISTGRFADPKTRELQFRSSGVFDKKNNDAMREFIELNEGVIDQANFIKKRFDTIIPLALVSGDNPNKYADALENFSEYFQGVKYPSSAQFAIDHPKVSRILSIADQKKWPVLVHCGRKREFHLPKDVHEIRELNPFREISSIKDVTFFKDFSFPKDAQAIREMNPFRESVHQIKNVINAAYKYPNAKFIAAHMGWINDYEKFSAHWPDNLFINTALPPELLINHLKKSLKEGFEDRIVFGSDEPFHNAGSLIDCVSANCSAEIARKILIDNPQKALLSIPIEQKEEVANVVNF